MLGDQGPWGGPMPGAPPPKRPDRRFRIGFIIWLALLAAAGLAYWGMTRMFPGQLSDMDQAQALRGLGFLALASSGLVYARRIDVGQSLRHLAIWAGIVGAVAIGFTYRDDLTAVALKVRGELIPAYAVTTTPHTLALTRSEDGGFYVMGQVNGAPVKFLIDTGASDSVLSPADAARLGVPATALTFSRASETANGVGYGAPWTAASLAVGPIRLSQFPMQINQAPMSTSLLGMTFVRRLDAFELRGAQLILTWKG